VLTEVLGRELAPLGVRVNAVAPGPVPTGFMAEVLAGGPEVAGAELYERTVAQHEVSEPTDGLLELIAFLLSPASAAVSTCPRSTTSSTTTTEQSSTTYPNTKASQNALAAP